MIGVNVSGSFRDTERYLAGLQRADYFKGIGAKYGPLGVQALKNATPEEHGETAAGWYYEVVQRQGYCSIKWANSYTKDPGHIPVAVLIQYGHATRSGTRVEGRDFINPAMRPIFDQIAADIWKEVTSAKH